MSWHAQVKVRQQWLTNVKKIRGMGAHKSMSFNSGWPVRKRQDEWKRASQRPPTVTDQSQKDKIRGTAQANVHQQWLTNTKTIRRVGAHKSKSTNNRWSMSKKTKRVGTHRSKSTNSDWPMSERQGEGERTCQSPPTVTDQSEKDTTSGSAKVKVHQQWLINVKKTRRVEAY